MKALLMLLKPFKGILKKTIKNEIKENKDKIISMLCTKVKLPMTGEEQEKHITDIYKEVEELILAMVDTIWI